jgi:predicted HTH domain antitoxin
MNKLTLEIPEDVVGALRLPPEDAERELRKELAVALYSRQILPLGAARRLTGMTRRDFEDLLAERQVLRAYTSGDLSIDIAHGLGSEPS